MISEAGTLLARRYARAFLSLFVRDITEEHCLAMKKAAMLLASATGKSWLMFFEFSSVTFEQQQAMATLLLKRLAVPDYLQSLVLLLSAHKRIELLPDVLNKIVGQFFEQKNIIEFTISSCPEITQEELKKLQKFLQEKSGKNIRTITRIDNRLIAGIRARSATLFWEYSLAKKLRDAQQMVLNGNDQ